MHSTGNKYVQVIKKTIGGVGITGCDFNFATAANMTEQVITLGALLPARAKLIDIFTFTNAEFTGAITLLAETGTTSSGNELIDSTTIFAADTITPTSGGITVVPVVGATTIYLSATPGANWSLVTAGRVSVYIIYVNLINI